MVIDLNCFWISRAPHFNVVSGMFCKKLRRVQLRVTQKSPLASETPQRLVQLHGHVLPILLRLLFHAIEWCEVTVNLAGTGGVLNERDVFLCGRTKCLPKQLLSQAFQRALAAALMEFEINAAVIGGLCIPKTETPRLMRINPNIVRGKEKSSCKWLIFHLE